ncbi:MAG: prepilin-type N-terminal cleavage/methylation domain-containing protein [Candidatus Berkelbacteria bacterium]|nr:prepilin-type N-terminal cleavage/methylation domain-containing protein [Candidatus Berkelbacteria bacterium]
MKKGFTLIEALITIAIIAILAGLSSLSIVNFGKSSDIEGGRTTVVQALRQAQSNSMANLDQKTWGVHFESSKVIIFADTGGVFNPADTNNQVKLMPKGVNIAFDFGGGVDLLFEKGKASTLTPGTITLSSTGNTTPEVTINSEGMIDY